MGGRQYTMGRRAESQEATRARIVEAIMQLHEELGPAKTTVTAIAQRAGVQRLTVYRHFPDERELFRACTSRWLELHSPPDPGNWVGIVDGRERCRTALCALYAYYRATERMWSASHREEPEVPALQPRMQAFRAYLDKMREDLLDALGHDHSATPELIATLGHVVRFSTWQSLAEENLSDEKAAELASVWLENSLRARSE